MKEEKSVLRYLLLKYLFYKLHNDEVFGYAM